MKKITAPDRFKEYLRHLILDHTSYKLVALFIALILWLTILGRRDFVLSKSIEVEIMTPPGYSVVTQSVDKVKVKVSGPRTALKRFMDSGLSQMVSVDAGQKQEGDFELEIPVNKIDVPFGVRVLQVRPNSVKFQLKKNN